MILETLSERSLKAGAKCTINLAAIWACCSEDICKFAQNSRSTWFHQIDSAPLLRPSDHLPTLHNDCHPQATKTPISIIHDDAGNLKTANNTNYHYKNYNFLSCSHLANTWYAEYIDMVVEVNLTMLLVLATM